MKKLLLILWQLPQELLGLILFLYFCDSYNEPFYFFNSNYIASFTLGDFIFINNRQISPVTLSHETGHKKQSHMLGPLYLLLIGLPSVIGNILHRFIKFNYYKQPWEAWADKLGDVER